MIHGQPPSWMSQCGKDAIISGFYGALSILMVDVLLKNKTTNTPLTSHYTYKGRVFKGHSKV